MTVATLLLTCLGFVLMGNTGKAATLTALTMAAVVCIAASNGGTTSQDLKTGYLVGATPRSQQIAILIGALTSALVIGVTLLLLNDAGTVYTKNAAVSAPRAHRDVKDLTHMEQPGGEYAEPGQDAVPRAARRRGRNAGRAGRASTWSTISGTIRYLVDPAINGKLNERDDGTAGHQQVRSAQDPADGPDHRRHSRTASCPGSWC